MMESKEKTTLLGESTSDTERSYFERSYFESGVDPSLVASMFEGAKNLAWSEPWFGIPDARTPFRVSIPSLGVDGAVLAMLEPDELESGIALFSHESHWKAWLEDKRLCEAHSDQVSSWSHIELILGEEDNLSETQCDEIQEKGWEVNSFFSYPIWYAVQGDEKTRALAPKELQILNAVTRAFSVALEGERISRWKEVWSGEEVMQLVLTTTSPFGVHEVRMSSQSVSGTVDLWKQLMTCRPGQIKKQVHHFRALNEELLYRYRFSKEGYGRGMGQPYLQELLEVARTKFRCSIAQISADNLERILTHKLRKSLNGPLESELDDVIETVRCFYTYLERKYDFDASEKIQRLNEGSFFSRVSSAWRLAA